MIRYLRIAFLLALGLVLLVVAFANRGPVSLRLLPEEMGTFLSLSWSVELPLFIVIFLGILAGLLIGFIWEWFREGKHRNAAATNSREAAKLQREVARLRKDHAAPKDEVLALLEEPSRAR